MNKKKMKEEEEEEEEEEEITVKWANHYSSNHQMLIVGDGDFSFSLCLANAFGSASNIVATSLDSHDTLMKKYNMANLNLGHLKKMGATILHEVDATKMKLHTDLNMRKFDRIVFNFPHAGFKGREDNMRVINLHRKLLKGFFRSASYMLRPYGEVHVTHKIVFPFDMWNIEELAPWNSLVLTELTNFDIRDYPGYNNKRGDSHRSDESFPLGECRTFKFMIGSIHKKKIVKEITLHDSWAGTNLLYDVNGIGSSVHHPPVTGTSSLYMNLDVNRQSFFRDAWRRSLILQYGRDEKEFQGLIAHYGKDEKAICFRLNW